MQLKIYKSLWGMEGSLEEQFERIANAGYDGVESAVKEISNVKKFSQLLQHHSLDYIPLIYTEGEDHILDFVRQLGIAVQFNPKKIIAHAGRDRWSESEQVSFFRKMVEIETEYGIPIAHETHRRRPFYSPVHTLKILQEVPDLHLNADLSHWCCVAESMLEEYDEAINLVADRAIHIHTRVGYENGPQVPDPRAPEWESHVLAFESWWQKIIESHKLRGEAELTITPEYGPSSYMHTLPYLNMPVADLWDVCLWSAERMRKLVNK
ncbi:MAG: TIM barrel protein [bacterium]